MAEIRKHKPGSTGSIGDLVRATVDPGPRPVAPGKVADPDFDPFFVAEEDAGTAAAAAAAPGFAATTIDTSGWFSFTPPVPATPAAPDLDEEPDTGEGPDED